MFKLRPLENVKVKGSFLPRGLSTKVWCPCRCGSDNDVSLKMRPIGICFVFDSDISHGAQLVTELGS